MSLLVFFCLASGCAPIDKWPIEPTPQPAGKEFDVRAAKTDLNGFPLNPQWVAQASDTSGPPLTDPCKAKPEHVFKNSACTQQKVRYDRAKPPTSVVCGLGSAFAGHVNFTPVTVTGTVEWLTWAAPWDNDVNFSFVSEDGFSGVTRGNATRPGAASPYIELEFTSDETLEWVSTEWWLELWRRVQRWSNSQDSDAQIRSWLNSTPPHEAQCAVVVGLFGLDCEHDCKSEVHPVFALALETERTETTTTWAILARNWGTEGFCASRLHHLTLTNQRLLLTLPGPGGGGQHLTGARLQEYATTYPDDTPDPVVESLDDGASAVVTLTLPDAKEQPLSEMRLTLEWTPAAREVRLPVRRPPLSFGERPRQPAAGGAEGRLAAATEASDRQARTGIFSQRRLVRPRGVPRTTPKRVPSVSVVRPFGVARVRPPRVEVPKERRPDLRQWLREREQRRATTLRTLCAHYDGQLPGFSAQDSRAVCGAAGR